MQPAGGAPSGLTGEERRGSHRGRNSVMARREIEKSSTSKEKRRHGLKGTLKTNRKRRRAGARKIGEQLRKQDVAGQ